MEIYTIHTILKPNNDIYIADSSAVNVITKIWPTEPVSKFSVFKHNLIADRIKFLFEKEYLIIDSAKSICAYDYLTPIIKPEERENYFEVLHSCHTKKKNIFECVLKFKRNKGALTTSDDSIASIIPWDGSIEYAITHITERIGNIWSHGITDEEWRIKQKEWDNR